MAGYTYDAFVSHNSADKPAVETIAAALEAQGLRCYLDKWDILPREQWLRNLETGLTASRTILIFIGTEGIGPYQQAEADAALRRQIQQREDCVIPVLLPGASPEDVAKLSVFLQGTHSLRFYDLHEPLPHRILLGLVRGDDPSHLRELIRQQTDVPADLLQTLDHWLSGLHIEWREQDKAYRVSEGQGKSCLRIPDLSASPNPDRIDYLLNWKSRLTPMLGREVELQALQQWAQEKAKISIRMLIGEGGVGKTRLAFELAAQLQAQGWQAGEAQGLEGEWYTGSLGSLLIIDYPEQRPEQITALLEALALMPPPQRKLRVLLLGRNGNFLNKLPQAAQSLVTPHMALSGLASDDPASWDLFQQAWQRLHALKGQAVPTLPMTPETFAQWRGQADLRNRPLFILALAIRLMLDPKATELGGKDIIRVLTQQYEVNRLKKEATKRSIDENALVVLRALAALSGRMQGAALRGFVQASAELKLDIEIPPLPQLKATSLWSEQALPALQPDLLAADLLHYALTESAADQAGPWQYLALAAAADSAQASSIFGRLIHDAQSVLGQEWPLDKLINWISQVPERCETLNPALNRSNLERTLLPLAIAIDKALLAQADSPQTRAHHLNNLSLRLAESGERAAGLQAIRRAVEIDEQLAKENFAAYGPDLAASLNNLSASLAESGERAAGLQAIRRAVEIYERLARENFAAYGPDLAASLNNRSVHLAELEQTEEAAQALARLETIKRQILDEQVQVPAELAWLFK